MSSIKDVKPIPVDRPTGFIDYTDYKTLDSLSANKYPFSQRGERLKKVRLEMKMSIGRASRVLNIGVSELLGLEMGSKTFIRNSAWKEAEEALNRFVAKT